jgi:ABC-type Co2+ transport system permease subunit
MTATAILLDQLTDPLRLGLLVALVAVLLRAREAGRHVPLLALAVAAVALLMPLAFPLGGVGYGTQAGLGLIATLGHLAVVLSIRHVVLRWLA